MGTTPRTLHASTAVELKQRIEAERRGEPFLLYRDGDGGQQIVSLAGGRDRLTIGRSAQTDLPLAWDPEVSRVHAELERIGPTWTLVDDGLSRNGSYVNDERVTGRRRLTDGDVLGLGDTNLVYRAPVQGESSVTLASDRSARAAAVTEAQRRVLVALCRPFADAGAFASPATNQQIADELFLSVAAVKTHLRGLFARFGIEGLPQNQKRLRLVELAFQTGAVNEHDV
jgi:pSer/pThr/pTyr-binding forkhead associated (FHA) protein